MSLSSESGDPPTHNRIYKHRVEFSIHPNGKVVKVREQKSFLLDRSCSRMWPYTPAGLDTSQQPIVSQVSNEQVGFRYLTRRHLSHLDEINTIIEDGISVSEQTIRVFLLRRSHFEEMWTMIERLPVEIQPDYKEEVFRLERGKTRLFYVDHNGMIVRYLRICRRLDRLSLTPDMHTAVYAIHWDGTVALVQAGSGVFASSNLEVSAIPWSFVGASSTLLPDFVNYEDAALSYAIFHHEHRLNFLLEKQLRIHRDDELEPTDSFEIVDQTVDFIYVRNDITQLKLEGTPLDAFRAQMHEIAEATTLYIKYIPRTRNRLFLMSTVIEESDDFYRHMDVKVFAISPIGEGTLIHRQKRVIKNDP